MATIDLMNLQPQKISRNLRGKTMLIYGAAGCGKTTLASKFKNVLIAGFESGTSALNNVFVQPIKSWSDWKQVVSQLSRKKELQEKFEQIAVDTADEAWELCVKWICSQNGVEKIGDLPYGQGYDLAKKEFSQTMRDLIFAGYGLIFISHSTEKEFVNEKGEKYTLTIPALPPRPFAIINKMVDLITYIREIDVGENEQHNRQRFMFFRDTVGDRFLVKSRYAHIVPYVKLDYKSLLTAIYDAIDKEISETGGEASEEENPYTQLDFDSLMEEARLLWGKVCQEEKVEDAARILEKEFGRPIKFSEIKENEVEKLNLVILQIRDIL